MINFSRLLILLIFSIIPGVLQASNAVEGIRSGIYKNGTRFVIDLEKSVEYKIFSNQNNNTIRIILPNLDWKIAKKRAFSRGSIVSYRYQNKSKISGELVLETNKKVDVYKNFILPPVDYKYYRLVIDLIDKKNNEVINIIEKKQFEQRKPLLKPKTQDTLLIVIDPGHGGVDGGAIGYNGSLEKDITLSIAKYLKKIINKSGRYKIVLTRETDKYLKLRQRIEIARKNKAKLFVSIHADSIQNSRIRGASIYTLSEKASDKEAEKLARRENKSDLIGLNSDLDDEDSDVAQILISLVQRETMNRSLTFASTFINRLKKNEKVLGRPNRKAGFVVLKASDVPSVLVEMGFMSNRADERKLQTNKFKRRLAEAFMDSFDKYFDEMNDN